MNISQVLVFGGDDGSVFGGAYLGQIALARLGYGDVGPLAQRGISTAHCVFEVESL